jgi:hypothetical protein
MRYLLKFQLVMTAPTGTSNSLPADPLFFADWAFPFHSQPGHIAIIYTNEQEIASYQRQSKLSTSLRRLR